MKVYLVCRARTVGRAAWAGDNQRARPLSEAGRAQAQGLVSQFATDPPVRVVSAPTSRCHQTVEPLCDAFLLRAEVDERLAVGADPVGPFELLAAEAAGPLLLCTHARVIRQVLRTLELVEGEEIPCGRSSCWVLEGPGDSIVSARYVESVSIETVPVAPEGSLAPVTRSAVLDLGSASFHMLIADVSASGHVARVESQKRMVQMGSQLHESGRISDELIVRSCEAVAEIMPLLRRHDVEHFFPVATAAVRSASNGAEAVRQLEAAMGHEVWVLSGEEEGRAIFRAARQRLGLGDGPAVGLDLGGGSLEVVIGRGEEVEAAISTRLGVVSLRRAIVEHDPMTRAEDRKLRDFVAIELEPHLAFLADAAGREGVVTGGTARALAKLLGHSVSRSEPCARLPFVSRRRLGKLCRSLIQTTRADRLRIEGVRPARADLLPTGLVLLDEVAHQLDLPGYQLCDWGLREGVLLSRLLPR